MDKRISKTFKIIFSSLYPNFNEDQTKNTEKYLKNILEKNSIYFDELGVVQDNFLELKGKFNITIDELIKSNKTWLAEYMDN